MWRPNVLVIAVDGLRASAQGAYGNTSYRTPTLDRFAGQSVLFDTCFADSTELSLLYRGLWNATSALRPQTSGEQNGSLPAELAKAGYDTRLVTDSLGITELAAAEQFSEAVLIDHEFVSDAIEIEQMGAARVVAETLEFVITQAPRSQRPWFQWAHLSGAYGSWDTPHELAMSLIEEGDAAPTPSIVPPNRVVDRSAQADEIFSETCRYAAQVMALDSLLAPLCDVLDSGAVGDCICVLMGTRGFPLGEHGQLGGVDGRLYSEQLHVPLLVRMPDCRGALSRVSQLICPADLSPTILRFLEIEDSRRDGMDILPLLDRPNSQWRSHLLAGEADRTLSIRTPSWYLRVADKDENESGELFVKPDDRWEMNDVTSLCSEVVDELTEFAIAERTRIEAGGAFATGSLPSHLVESMH